MPTTSSEARTRRRRLVSLNHRGGGLYDPNGHRVGRRHGLVWGAFGHAKPIDFERFATGTTGAGARAHLIIEEQ